MGKTTYYDLGSVKFELKKLDYCLYELSVYEDNTSYVYHFDSKAAAMTEILSYVEVDSLD